MTSIHLAMDQFPDALAFFVGTSVAIGLVAATSSDYTIIPIGLGPYGAALLLYAATLLIRESRFALAAVNAEMDFIWARGKALGPEDLVKKGMKRLRWFGGVR